LTLPRAGRPPLPRPIICLITDRTLVTDCPLEELVAAAVAGGVNMVQLREKDLPPDELLDLTLRIRDVIGSDARLLVNGSLDVAIDAVADGVHLPSDGIATAMARMACGGRLLVGRSAHNVAEVTAAASTGADYVELGTIFPSRSHPDGEVQGLAPLAIAACFGVPILAVGGIDAVNAEAVMAAGASGVAVISAILADPDPQDAARRLADVVRRAWQQMPPVTAAPPAPSW
jgi:thiamine-phosphate pyrophosphorylase